MSHVDVNESPGCSGFDLDSVLVEVWGLRKLVVFCSVQRLLCSIFGFKVDTNETDIKEFLAAYREKEFSFIFYF